MSGRGRDRAETRTIQATTMQRGTGDGEARRRGADDAGGTGTRRATGSTGAARVGERTTGRMGHQDCGVQLSVAERRAAVQWNGGTG